MAGPVDIDPAKPHAFLSYTRFDDNFLNGGISALREALELAVQARTGKKFNIFQDVDDIKPGDAWRKKLDRAIEAAQLFIPILTPSFFESDFCRGEAEAFLAYEARAGRDDLVLPIYLIDTPKLDDDDQRAIDVLASRLHERQYDDWRPLRFKLQHHDTLPRFDELAGAIALAIARNGQAVQPPPEPTLPKEVMDRISALEARLQERDQTVADERSKREQAESALSEEKAKIHELSRTPLAVDNARKRETKLQGEIEHLKKQLVSLSSGSAKLRNAEATDQRGDTKEKIKVVIGAAVLALLVMAGMWMIGKRAGNDELATQIDELNSHQFELEATLSQKENEIRKLAGSLAETEQKMTAFKDCPGCPEMVVIPAGEFLMGSPDKETGRVGREGPQHAVSIQRTFALGRYEVTFAEWDECVAVGACKHQPDDKGWGRGRRPVINVNWEDAQQYVAWLNSLTNEKYRLPSESEWEYAARAGTITAYYWGDEIGENQANCIGCGSEWDNKKTAPVGSFNPNPFRLFDMHGNVYEWVEDCLYDSYEGAPTDGGPHVSEADGATSCLRVLRSGSWFTESIRGARSAWRSFYDINNGRGQHVGFRVAKDIR